MRHQITKVLLFTGLVFLAVYCQKEEAAEILQTADEEIITNDNDSTSQTTTTSSDSEVISFRTIGDTPSGWSSANIGNANGSAEINTCSETTTASASGFSLPNSDVIHFAHVEKCGDFEMVAHIDNIGNPGWAGIMIREDNSPGARKVALKSNLTNFIRRDVRTSPNGFAQSQQIPKPGAQWLKLVRSGNNFQGYVSKNGQVWQFVMATTLTLPNCVQAGLFVEGRNANTITDAGFVNVDLGLPEVCDGFDNDCDGEVDEGFDQDGDGFTTCQGDCNDNDGSIKPDATEVCDGIDNNCNSQTDEGFDQDGDGFTTCQGDCDDNNGDIHPGAAEDCDNVDNNCNGQIDEGCCTTDGLLPVVVDPDQIPGNEDDFTIYVHPTDNATNIEWGGFGIDIPGLVNTIGFNFDGESNTQAIVDELGEGNYAAKICADLVAFGCDDWYLPSKGEFRDIALQYDFSHNQQYWTSTESSSVTAWGYAFGPTNWPKDADLFVNCRCVRKE